jgi:hypothetical protein
MRAFRMFGLSVNSETRQETYEETIRIEDNCDRETTSVLSGLLYKSEKVDCPDPKDAFDEEAEEKNRIDDDVDDEVDSDDCDDDIDDDWDGY